MLHSLDLARPSQIINGYSQEVPEIRDKTIESVTPPRSLPKAARRTSARDLSSRRNCNHRGFKDRSVTGPREGQSRDREGGHRDCYRGRAGRHVR